jgi:hypothetical protein
MNKTFYFGMAMLVLTGLAGCGDNASSSDSKPQQAAPNAAVGKSCSVTCPDVGKVEITCAVNEKPVCDCAATPKVQCKS